MPKVTLPGSSARRRLRDLADALRRPRVRQVAHNTFWLFSDRAFRLGVSFLVGVWVARYLGPVRFGEFNYVIAFVSLFATAMTAGTDNLVVRDLARTPERASEIMAAATLIRVVGTPVVLVAIAAVAMGMHGGDAPTLLLIAIYSSTLLFRPTDVIDLWFQAETNVRPTVWARNLAILVASGAKVALILTGASLVAFVALEPLTAALVAMLLLLAYRSSGRRLSARGASRADVRRLLVDGLPLLLSGVAIMIYMRIDQVMLEHLAGGGTRQVGLYSVAQRLSEVWYFLPMAVTSSLFPTLVRSRNADPALYLQRLLRLFSLMSLVAIAVAGTTTLLSSWIIQTVFGSSYAGAGPILAIHVWTSLFVFWGVVGETWYLNEGLTRLTFYRTGSAAAANVLLNFVLIPRYGGLGAAVATLVSQAWSASLSNLLWKRTRPLFLMQVRSLGLRGLLG